MITDLSTNNCVMAVIGDAIDNPVNKWSNIVLTQRFNKEGGFIPVYEYDQYYNGKKMTGTASTFGPFPIPVNFSFGGIIGGNNYGGNYNNNYDFLKGDIDDIRIYNRSLSDDEVMQLYKLKE